MTNVNFEKKDKMAEREEWVDSLRGFSIIVIVIGHVLLGLDASDGGTTHPLVKFAILFFYSFNIPLFFFIAGTVNNDKKKKARAFFIDLLKWVVWPYVLWSFILVFCQNIPFSGANNVHDYTSLLNIYYKPVSLYWFLYAYFCVRVINYVLIKLNFYSFYVLSLICLFVFLLMGFYYNDNGLIYNISFGFFFFACGVKRKIFLQNTFCKKLVDKKNLMLLVAFISLTAILLISVLNYIKPEDEIFLIYTFQKTVVFSGLFSIVLFSIVFKYITNDFSRKILALIGMYSMVIYIQHTIISAALRSVLFHFDIKYFVLNTVILSLVGVICPIIWQLCTDALKLSPYFGIRPVNNQYTHHIFQRYTSRSGNN